MKILDFINSEIAKNQEHIYDVCFSLHNATSEKIREKTFKETFLNNVIPFATDRNADVFEAGLDSVIIILNVEPVRKLDKTRFKFYTKKYKMLYVSKDCCEVLLSSDYKEDLLDTYAYALSKGFVYAIDTTFSVEYLREDLKKTLKLIEENKSSTDGTGV